jgi:hypothetical protein
VNSYSADVDDADALLSAIVTLSQSSDQRRQIAHNARETVSQLPWGAVLSPLEAVYDELIDLRRNRMGPPSAGPDWMSDPQALLRASCAADALANVIPRVRNRSMSVGKGIRMLHEMLNNQSLVDIAKGAAMLKGRSFKVPTPKTTKAD